MSHRLASSPSHRFTIGRSLIGSANGRPWLTHAMASSVFSASSTRPWVSSHRGLSGMTLETQDSRTLKKFIQINCITFHFKQTEKKDESCWLAFKKDADISHHKPQKPIITAEDVQQMVSSNIVIYSHKDMLIIVSKLLGRLSTHSTQFAACGLRFPDDGNLA
jgi:hypothetical protein